MSINVRFSPDLVLRNFSEHLSGSKEKDECIPEDLKENKAYSFLKTGQRVYWLDGEQPLLEKSVNGEISPPIASITVLEVTHLKLNGKIWTRGKYLVKKVLEKNEIYFNGCEPIKIKKG